jgi:DNA-binding transcriptional ArsR family regulator
LSVRSHVGVMPSAATEGLTNTFVNAIVRCVIDIAVIEEPAAAAAALDPLRARLLAELHEPASAAELAQRIGLPRQKLNYHLRALESHGLLRVAEERRHGGLTERRLVATAAAYVIAPDALGANAPDPARVGDRLSARYLLALAARLLREVGTLLRHSETDDRRVATLALDTEIGFASPADRVRFAEELTNAITRLAARYHHDDGHAHRLVVVAHPLPKE